MTTTMKVSSQLAVVSSGMGPIFMMLGSVGSQETILLIPAYVGALSLGVSLLFLVKAIDFMRAELAEIKKRVAESVAV